MRNLILIIFFSFFSYSFVLKAQSKSKFVYYDETWRETQETNASYYIKYTWNKKDLLNKKDENSFHSWDEEVYRIDGQKISKGGFYYAFYDGTWVRYHSNGEASSVEKFDRGKFVSKKTYYDNGQIKSNGIKSFYRSGELEYEKVDINETEHKSIQYYISGKIKEVTYYKDEKVVIDTTFTKNGDLQSFTSYYDGYKNYAKTTQYPIEAFYELKYKNNDTIVNTLYTNEDIIVSKIIVLRNDTLENNIFDQETFNTFYKIDDIDKNDDVKTLVELMPYYPYGCEDVTERNELELCGQTNLIKFIGSIKYPEVARDLDIQAKEFIRFVIDQEGKVIDIESVKGSKSILTEAAIRHISTMKKWIPGEQRGKKVKVQYVVPINFRLG